MVDVCVCIKYAFRFIYSFLQHMYDRHETRFFRSHLESKFVFFAWQHFSLSLPLAPLLVLSHSYSFCKLVFLVVFVLIRLVSLVRPFHSTFVMGIGLSDYLTFVFSTISFSQFISISLTHTFSAILTALYLKTIFFSHHTIRKVLLYSAGFLCSLSQVFRALAYFSWRI